MQSQTGSIRFLGICTRSCSPERSCGNLRTPQGSDMSSEVQRYQEEAPRRSWRSGFRRTQHGRAVLLRDTRHTARFGRLSSIPMPGRHRQCPLSCTTASWRPQSGPRATQKKHEKSSAAAPSTSRTPRSRWYTRSNRPTPEQCWLSIAALTAHRFGRLSAEGDRMRRPEPMWHGAPSRARWHFHEVHGR